MMTETRIAPIDPEKVKKDREWFEHALQRDELAKVLPKGMTPEGFVRIVLTTHTKVPKLWNTTLKSRWLAICEAAALGLPLDGKMAALVPYKNTARCDVMYQGMVQLAHRHPAVSMMHTVAVYEGDTYTYREGLKPVIEHVPWRRDTEPKVDELIACYSWALVRGGGRPFRWMWKAEIDKNHRDKSPAYNGGYGPWIDYPIPMYLKTPVRQLCKMIPQSTELMTLLAREDDPEDERPASALPEGDAIDVTLDAIAGDGEQTS